MITRITPILFADIAGFSKIQDDSKKLALSDFFHKCIKKNNDKKTIFHEKTWGDAVLVCFEKCAQCVEFAFELKENFINLKEEYLDLGFIPQIRIAINVAEIIIINEGGKTEVIGKGIDLTARLEPITKSNHIYCSDLFYRHFRNTNVQNIVGIKLGQMALVKGYGTIVVYELIYKSEVENYFTELVNKIIDEISFSIYANYKEYLLNTEETHKLLIYIKEKIKKASIILSKSNPDIRFEITERNNNICKFESWINRNKYSELLIFSDDFSIINYELLFQENSSMNVKRSIRVIKKQSDYYYNGDDFLGKVKFLDNEDIWLKCDDLGHLLLRLTINGISPNLNDVLS